MLHRDNGHPGWGRFEALLAERFTVYLPSHPGFHGSAAASWTWLESVRDVAAVYQALLSALGLGPVRVVGHGFGGWLAAEMATLDHGRFAALVLVNPMGILPGEGEIFDQFLVNSETYAKQMFSDPAAFESAYGAEPSVRAARGVGRPTARCPPGSPGAPTCTTAPCPACSRASRPRR